MSNDDSIDDLLDELDSHGDLEAAEQLLSIRMEKRRYGKPVTIVEGFDLPKSELKSVASDLKSSVGTGGTVDGGRIELQGDHRDRVPELLRERGFNVET
ncbi:stress response translation initiation inhibitor YciH [Natronococcus sp. A-GB1]|uniref:stress response translation initiation inhibitor YciH n=1 Tax=Natronococcus sp. A-GB1 TaxID=3037648 RepID=UPI00241E80F4|nr:stress response translation initiation inhibitor YciH [Natronococcus sp. A-GB1]MDG5758534.1 stress response translation initiation inhibitor YciH [Natronococcus sp. A-GB1]